MILPNIQIQDLNDIPNIQIQDKNDTPNIQIQDKNDTPNIQIHLYVWSIIYVFYLYVREYHLCLVFVC
jgi:hypothetical protein